MRFKSYYAPSVQVAIAMARREFGDEVTLVTSHVTAPDTRHLGEYEVVFAIDEPENMPSTPVALSDESAEELDNTAFDSADRDLAQQDVAPVNFVSAEPRFTAFQEALLDAVLEKPAAADVAQRVESVRATLIELGIEPNMVRALMTLIERSVDAAALPTASGDDAPVLSELTDSLVTVAEPKPNTLTDSSIDTVVDEVFASLAEPPAATGPNPSLKVDSSVEDEPVSRPLDETEVKTPKSPFPMHTDASNRPLTIVSGIFFSGTTVTPIDFSFPAAPRATASASTALPRPAVLTETAPAPVDAHPQQGTRMTAAELAFFNSISETTDTVVR